MVLLGRQFAGVELPNRGRIAQGEFGEFRI
jgi:hypothetical protein